MAKMNLSKVKIMDTQTNQIVTEYETDVEPKKSTLGNSLFGTLTSKGMSELQAKGFPVHNDNDYSDLIKQTFQLSDEAMDSGRGGRWDTPELRARFKVFINDQEYNPALTQKQLEKIEAKKRIKEAKMFATPIVKPTLVATPTPVTPAIPETTAIPQMPPTPTPTQAVADTTPKVADNEIIGKIKTFRSQGANDTEIFQKLVAGLGESKANELWIKATTPAIPVIVAPVVPTPVAPQPVATPIPPTPVAPVMPQPFNL